jgi:hypothetical protein
MGYPTIKEVTSFKTILDLFNLASGIVINHEKTQIFFFNTPPYVQRHFSTFLGFQISSLLAKYLGAPLLFKMLHDPCW